MSLTMNRSHYHTASKVIDEGPIARILGLLSMQNPYPTISRN
jgi:hypothetical protein